MRLSRLLAAALLSLGLTGCAESGVVRVFDGREVLGPYISELAYAAYAEAEERAAHGEVAEAMSAFQRAAQEDPGSVQIWTRLGAVSCLRSAPGRGSSTVESAFRRAEAIDPRYAPLWRERARCHLRGEPDREVATTTTPAEREAAALEASGKAVALDPDDVEAAAVRATLLLRNGRADEARRLMEAVTIRTPTSAESFLALFNFGLAAKDEALAQRAGERVLALAPRLASRVEADLPALRPLSRLDAALRDDDLPRAQRIALHARISSTELALRAAALGRVSLARRQAEALAGADPADLSARVALAVAADLGGDLDALDASVRALPPAVPGAAPPALSPLARLLFAELLERRLGAEAARLWLGPGAALATDDALIEAIDRRVRARLEGAALRIASPSP